jgi:hypothetical protein
LAGSKPDRREGYVEFERDGAIGEASKDEELWRADWPKVGAED